MSRPLVRQEQALAERHVPWATSEVDRLWSRLPKHIRKREDLYHDSLQECLLAVTEAARTHDPQAGSPFRAYAARAIERAFYRTVLNVSVIRTTAYARRLRKRYGPGGEGASARQKKTLDQAGEAQATMVSLSADEAADMPDPKNIDPLEALIEEEEERQERAQAIGRLREVMAGLEEKHRKVLELRYGIGGEGKMTLEQVGAALGKPTSTVQRWQEEAEKMLATRLQK